jgi:YebC/PmpR family DNA-binding regulatory protein
MSGHSKWAGIKHKKGAADAKRGQVFSKLAKELTMAARDSGGNPDMNPKLRMLIAKAKEANMPGDNVERAIKRGTGELPGVSYESVSYEGYGQGGVAILVDCLTDNKNRASSEIRNIFSKKGGNLAGAGSVAWQFQKKGYILVSKKDIEEDKLMSLALDAGAEDFKADPDEVNYEVITDPKDFEKVRESLAKNNVKIESAEITMIPSSYIKLQGAQAEQLLSLIEELEEHEDVQNVYANFDIPDEIIEKHKAG